MILGVGVDILSIARISAIVGRGATDRFARRILCKCELTSLQTHTTAEAKTGFLATRWCLKEALYKAAYPHQVLRWHDIRVYKEGPKLAAEVSWSPSLPRINTHVSISHDQGLLVGYAVIEAP
ncbi:hypothetical protein IWW50_006981 [Coemansia erecta]|nr:hypothetical protein IWW50_006981 [Coemansia erecta]